MVAPPPVLRRGELLCNGEKCLVVGLYGRCNRRLNPASPRPSNAKRPTSALCCFEVVARPLDSALNAEEAEAGTAKAL